MSLLLCRQESVSIPYEIGELGIHLYSSQELCYVIYHHPLLVMENFISQNLITFIREQLQMPYLAEKIDAWIADRGESDEILSLILQECFYYTPEEQQSFRQKVKDLRSLSEPEYQKKRADYFCQLKLYGKAMDLYEEILDRKKEWNLTDSFCADIYNNLGACLSNLFCFQRALHAYEDSYALRPDEKCLRQMFLVTLLGKGISMKDSYQDLITPEQQDQWLEEVIRVQTEKGKEAEAVRVARLFEKPAEECLRDAGKMIMDWKLQYRKMI